MHQSSLEAQGVAALMLQMANMVSYTPLMMLVGPLQKYFSVCSA